jgi:hypothetical protein
MSEINNIANQARNILSEVAVLEQRNRSSVERNASLMRAIATIKSNLERALRQPQNLNASVYDSIDLARSVTPYTNAGKVVVDPPLTDAEKTLP